MTQAGRPGIYTKQIMFAITEDQLLKLDILVGREGISRSEFIRQLVKEYIKNNY